MGDKVQKGDFIEVQYTGSVDSQVFDTTDEAKAKELGIHNPTMPYGSIKICIGRGHLLKGLDEEVEGKEAGKEYDFHLKPEQAFGKKDAKLIRLIQKTKFTSQNINPQPGLVLNIDGAMATIKTISGGRVLVDFNHPLAGKEVDYHIKIVRKITELKEKIEAMIAMEINIKPEGYKMEISEGKVTVTFTKEAPDVIEAVQEELSNRIKDACKEVKEIAFKKQ
ncbi:peptidylprolyl isomerase [Candidatus Woesearchaeota archaeon]|nr:peptidylprolyl isomerase [Candidatus Woesearchaeota archaeon]